MIGISGKGMDGVHWLIGEQMVLVGDGIGIGGRVMEGWDWY